MERVKSVLMDGNLNPLPEAEKQVQALGRLYGASRSRVYTGAEAREERVKAEAGDYRILQLATHGILNDASPMYSHVMLAQGDSNTDKLSAEDGLLEAWEIMNLNLNADLVVLSACETARGRVGAGEGVIGLTWALFVAGSPTTIVSQWKVESASTTQLMVDFHRQLQTKIKTRQAGTSTAKALQSSALKMLRSSEYRHPFYWAGFVIVGDGN
jgi:CHAT domain-containing protein